MVSLPGVRLLEPVMLWGILVPDFVVDFAAPYGEYLILDHDSVRQLNPNCTTL